jgi:hypothetical protein
MRMESSLNPLHDSLERDTLRLLCSNLIRPVTRVELTGLLDSSLFDDPLHRTVLEEMSALGSVSPVRLRELLPARITNRGFPDFNLNEFLGRDQATEDEIEKLFRSVLQMIELRHRDDGSVPEA